MSKRPRPNGDADDAVGVGAFLRSLNATLKTRGARVRGEVTSVHAHAASGHVYFSLGDAEGTVECAMWRTQASKAASGAAAIVPGAHVVVHGTPDIYAKAGRLKLTTWKVEALGAPKCGRRQKKEELLAALADEGALDADRKRAIPFLPRVGVVTSVGSAAHADFSSGVLARWPGYAVEYAPTTMQGVDAPASIQASLASLVAAGCDVVVCARGGGSEEDLSTFDDEAVVRALAACPVPVVSAVGHESDTTIADLVADRRAKTPTASVEMVVPERAAVVGRLQAAAALLSEGAALSLAGADASLQAACVKTRAGAHAAVQPHAARLVAAARGVGASRGAASRARAALGTTAKTLSTGMHLGALKLGERHRAASSAMARRVAAATREATKARDAMERALLAKRGGWAGRLRRHASELRAEFERVATTFETLAGVPPAGYARVTQGGRVVTSAVQMRDELDTTLHFGDGSTAVL